MLGTLADIALDEMKAEAVKRGAAEWVVDPTNGETTFKWKGDK